MSAQVMVTKKSERVRRRVYRFRRVGQASREALRATFRGIGRVLSVVLLRRPALAAGAD